MAVLWLCPAAQQEQPKRHRPKCSRNIKSDLPRMAQLLLYLTGTETGSGQTAPPLCAPSWVFLTLKLTLILPT